jgi:tRNA threonylcarbamoyladenosine biosynthesis protein TsaB
VSGVLVALETSSRPASVAARRGERVVEVALEAGRAHASDLLPALDRILRELEAEPADIVSVLVGTGPGSYTGLRVGIATALGIARGAGAGLRGVPSGETLCFGELAPGEEAAVLLDARAGELYFARYRRTRDEIEVLRAPCVLRPGEVGAALPPGIPIFGDAEAREAAGLDAVTASRFRAGVVPRALALLALGAARLERLGPQKPAEVAPLYLRPFAVRQRRR